MAGNSYTLHHVYLLHFCRVFSIQHPTKLQAALYLLYPKIKGLNPSLGEHITKILKSSQEKRNNNNNTKLLYYYNTILLYYYIFIFYFIIILISSFVIRQIIFYFLSSRTGNSIFVNSKKNIYQHTGIRYFIHIRTNCV